MANFTIAQMSKKLLAATALAASLAGGAHAYDYKTSQQDPRAEKTHTCVGILTVNGTLFSNDNGPTRLIRDVNDITKSCLFERASADGNKIYKVCRMGHFCEVKARVNSDSSDVNYIVRVVSVRAPST
jgi:hypothetical protein